MAPELEKISGEVFEGRENQLNSFRARRSGIWFWEKVPNLSRAIHELIDRELDYLP